jgi:ankyrin repeat protein
MRIPNELKLVFADCLDLDDLNSLVRTSRALNQLLTPYMYRRAKDLMSRDGRPYFLEAVDARNLSAARHFIEVGTSVDMNDKMERDRPTALHSCVLDGNLRIARLLIKHGVNVSAETDFGCTPLHYAVSNQSETFVRLLVDAGADIFASSTICGTILYTATMFGTASMVHLLLERGAIPTIWNPVGDTLLHCPSEAWAGTAATVGLLLEAGVNIEATNVLGETPLHRAAKYGREDYVKELLQWGANVDTIDNEGCTPLQAFLSWRPSTSAAHQIILHHETLPQVRASKGREACLPTWRSVEFNEPVVDLLLSAGADISASRDFTCSPFDWAAVWLDS